jgi:hypothetical protein
MTKFSIGGPARAALAALAAVLLLAAPASAADPGATSATGGTTTLKLGGTTAGLLSLAGVSVKAVSPATKSASGLKFPISGGTIRPATLLGSINHRGAIRFSLGGKSIVLRSLRVTVTKKGASMSATVSGQRTTILRLNLAGATIAGSGANKVTASNIAATLSPQGARAINKEIGTSLFKSGLKVGTVSAKITLKELVIGAGGTTLTPAPDVSAALTALGVTITPAGRATATASGINFPITGGKVNPKTFFGTILHAGSGVTFTRGAASITLSDFAIQIDSTPSLSALVGGTRLEILALDTSKISISAAPNGLIAANLGATLTAASAAALNAAFNTTVFSAGLRLGTVAIGAKIS